MSAGPSSNGVDATATPPGGTGPVKVKFLPGDQPTGSKEFVYRHIGEEASSKEAAAGVLGAYWIGVLQKHNSDYKPSTDNPPELLTIKEETFTEGKWEITLKGCQTGHLDELAFESLLPKEALFEWLEMLAGQRQLVFSGAPGCGKTYLARRLAMWLLQRDKERYDLVQFSAGYAYEDFVQGLRAKADEAAINSTIMKTAEMIGSLADGSLAKVEEVTLPTDAVRKADEDGKCQLKLDSEQGKAILTGGATAAAQVIGTSKTFQAAPGPLVALSGKPVSPSAPAPEAGSDLDKLLKTLGAAAWQLKVLVIDEMNRAKVADVFGECFFLLENRGAKVTLRYSGDEKFCLDKNLLIIGTMNSTDRGTDKQLDVAFAQRFSWVELAPDEKPVLGLLPAYLYSLEMEGVTGAQDAAKWLPGLVDKWNDVLADEGKAQFAIGPRFFLNKSLYEGPVKDGIVKLWRNRLYPYLQLVFRSSDMHKVCAIFERMKDVKVEGEDDGVKVDLLPSEMMKAMKLPRKRSVGSLEHTGPGL